MACLYVTVYLIIDIHNVHCRQDVCLSSCVLTCYPEFAKEMLYKCVYFYSQVFPPSWHLLHLHLDIHWLVLEILHVAGEKMMSKYLGFSLELIIVRMNDLDFSP